MEKNIYCPECGERLGQGDWYRNHDSGLIDVACPVCGWKGNETDVDHDEIRIWDDSLDEEELEKDGYGIMTWPESQALMERDGFFDNCWLINDVEGFDTYGSCAFVYDKEWFGE